MKLAKRLVIRVFSLPLFADLSESSSRRSLGVSLQALAASEPGSTGGKKHAKNTQKWLGKEAIYDRVID